LAPLAVALTVASSCGGGSGSGPLTFDKLKTEFVPAVCKELVACGQMPDQATCQATLHFATSELETFQVDIGNGKIVYDASADLRRDDRHLPDLAAAGPSLYVTSYSAASRPRAAAPPAWPTICRR
jgi:hypothetical protein